MHHKGDKSDQPYEHQKRIPGGTKESESSTVGGWIVPFGIRSLDLALGTVDKAFVVLTHAFILTLVVRDHRCTAP